MTRRIGGSGRTSTPEITTITPPRDRGSRGTDRPDRGGGGVTVDPVYDGQKSHVTIRLDFHGHGIGKMLLPMVVRQARKEAPRSCQNLKKRLEAVRTGRNQASAGRIASEAWADDRITLRDQRWSVAGAQDPPGAGR